MVGWFVAVVGQLLDIVYLLTVDDDGVDSGQWPERRDCQKNKSRFFFIDLGYCKWVYHIIVVSKLWMDSGIVDK